MKKKYFKENERKETPLEEIETKKKSYARGHGLFLGLLPIERIFRISIHILQLFLLYIKVEKA